MSHDLKIPASVGNPVDSVKAVGRNNILPALPEKMPHPSLGLDNLGPVFEVCAKHKSSASFPDWKKINLPSS